MCVHILNDCVLATSRGIMWGVSKWSLTLDFVQSLVLPALKRSWYSHSCFGGSFNDYCSLPPRPPFAKILPHKGHSSRGRKFNMNFSRFFFCLLLKYEIFELLIGAPIVCLPVYLFKQSIFGRILKFDHDAPCTWLKLYIPVFIS